MRKESNQTTESKDAHSLLKSEKMDKGMLRRIILALFLLSSLHNVIISVIVVQGFTHYLQLNMFCYAYFYT